VNFLPKFCNPFSVFFSFPATLQYTKRTTSVQNALLSGGTLPPSSPLSGTIVALTTKGLVTLGDCRQFLNAALIHQRLTGTK